METKTVITIVEATVRRFVGKSMGLLDIGPAHIVNWNAGIA